MRKGSIEPSLCCPRASSFTNSNSDEGMIKIVVTREINDIVDVQLWLLCVYIVYELCIHTLSCISIEWMLNGETWNIHPTVTTVSDSSTKSWKLFRVKCQKLTVKAAPTTKIDVGRCGREMHFPFLKCDTSHVKSSWRWSSQQIHDQTAE